MPRERSAARSALFVLIVVLLLTMFVEGLSWLAYGGLTSEPYSASKVSARRHELVGNQPNEEASPLRASLQKYVPHPYLGYVLNPERFQDARQWWVHAEHDPFQPPANVLQVVVVGGSMAFNLRSSGELLLESLANIEEYRDRQLRLVTLAGLGYKQPQQLLAVAYFVSLGGRVDLLLNLDGFNEIGSEIDRNLRQGVTPSYPSFWSQVTRDLGSASELQSLGEIVFLRRARVSAAEVFEHASRSPTANLLWLLLDRKLAAAIQLRIAQDFEVATGPFYSRGPAFAGTPKDVREFAVRLWRDGSLGLQRFADGYGFPYFHFLQPNQYVPGSKRTLSAIERDEYTSRESFRRIIGRWYPELQTAGAELKASGVHFFDLTALFRDVEFTAYSDSCCHLSDRGRDRLVESVASRVAQWHTDRRSAAE